MKSGSAWIYPPLPTTTRFPKQKKKKDKPHSHTVHKNLLNKQAVPLVFFPHQIQQWEQNLERFNMDLFRMRCYLASLQGGELPNPKSLLAFASRPTKTTLGRLGIFSVSSFHALVRERACVCVRYLASAILKASDRRS